MKKLLLAAIFCLCLILASCGDTPEAPPEEAPAKEYTITIVTNEGKSTIVCKEGEIPSLPEVESYVDGKLLHRFLGWDKEVSAVTADTTYSALYDENGVNCYTIRWVLDSGVYTSTVAEGELPIPPKDFDQPIDKPNATLTFGGWDKEITAASGDTLYKAKYYSESKTFEVKFVNGDEVIDVQQVIYGYTPETVKAELKPLEGFNYVRLPSYDINITEDTIFSAINTVYPGDMLDYAETNGNFALQTNFFTGGSCLLYLLMEVRHSPDPESFSTAYYAEKTAEYLAALCENGGKFLTFDLGPTWGNTTLTAALAVAKQTPAVWNRLTEENIEVLDFIMECFAYIQCFGTDDDNNYSTGPAMQGNYGKGWNPNYRLANVPPMLFCAAYMGGADKVNNSNLCFNFDEVVEKFTEYGFTAAYNGWTKEAPELADGSLGPTAKEFLTNGGKAYLKSRTDPTGRLDYNEGTAAGNGVGVRTTYTYHTYQLRQAEEIIEDLLNYCYSGGAVINSYGTYADGSPKAYILDGTSSPYVGLPGMFLEFKSGDGGDANTKSDIRSSCSYNHHNFVMVMSMLSAFEELGIYDVKEKKNRETFAIVWVGNNDFLYKYSHGYMSYSLSKPYESHESSSAGYYLWKSYWLGSYSDLLTIETLPNTGPSATPQIFKEDYSSTSININENSSSKNGVSYTCDGKTGCSMITKQENNDTYLEVKQTAGGKDPIINLSGSSFGGLNGVMGDSTTVIFSIDLALGSSGAASSSQFRLRESSSAQVVVLFSTNASDNTVSMDGVTLTTLTNEFQTISIKVDFKAGTLTGYVNGEEIATVSFAPPASGTGSTTESWLESLNNYIFNWWFQSNSSDSARSLKIDDIVITRE